jgi:hypothetical protein
MPAAAAAALSALEAECVLTAHVRAGDVALEGVKNDFLRALAAAPADGQLSLIYLANDVLTALSGEVARGRALSAALRQGAAEGEIGRLDIGTLDVKPLEDALRLTLQLGPETPEARCLAATVLHVRSLRLADDALCAKVSPDGRFLAVALLEHARMRLARTVVAVRSIPSSMPNARVTGLVFW